jgi:uncharacterized secreted protein with C-terminal beta-propeller domain
MSDRLDDAFGTVDRPRPLEAAFQGRLEQAIVEASNSGPMRWRIDRPRALPPGAVERILAALLRRRRRFLAPVKLIAAAVAVSMVAAATYVVTDRLGSEKDGGGPAAVTAPTLSPSPSISATASPTARPAPSGPSTLRGFSSSTQFLSYVRTEGLKESSAYGIPGAIEGGRGGYGGPSPGEPPGQVALPSSPATSTHSQTNVQESGVDEPDIVKTDGRHMVIWEGPLLRVFDVRKGARLTDSVELPSRFDGGLFLSGDTVVVIGSRFGAPKAAEQITHVHDRMWTNVTAYTIEDPTNIRLISSMDVEGELVDARLVRGVVRMVVRSSALGPQPVFPTDSTAKAQKKAESANARAIRASSVGDWVPHYVIQRGRAKATTGHLHDWSSVSHPSGRPGLGMLSLVTFVPEDPQPENAVSVIGAGDTLYASAANVYVTSMEVSEEDEAALVTRIHKFDISDPSRAAYVASGEVAGRVLNKFSMSEYAGRLRVATTLSAFGQDPESSSSTVYVLSERSGRLVVTGSVGNLGKGERIYSVRFLGPMGYVVTFRELDPLYVVDLRKPSRPRVRGLLKIPGYSEYLHPLSTDSILGIGRDASSSGAAKGLQVSLFDVSDPSAPRRTDNMIQGKFGYSGLEYEPHGFLYWAPERLVVIPAVLSDTEQTADFVGALAFTVGDEIGAPTKITHAGRSGTSKSNPPAIVRSVIVGRRLLTISSEGVLISDLGTLDDRAWVPFSD